MPFSEERLAALLAQLDSGWSSSDYCVALSGGLDSTVLLAAMTALLQSGQVRRLRAAHIDHGLQPESARWAEDCRARCAALDVPLATLPLALSPPPGASVEAEARTARYAAFARLLEPGEWLLTAHHRDDQLETVLIQLLRGAGVAGLSAMPARARLGPGWHGRPLLDVDRAEIADYAKKHQLTWLTDPSNAAPRFDRGYLRGSVLPAIRARWPAAAATVSRSASHLAQASRLLSDLAAIDAAGVIDEGRLRVDGLQRLSHDRQVNLLRCWIHARGIRPPAAARLRAALDEMLAARVDAMPLVRWPEGEFRRYRGRLYAMPPLTDPPAIAGNVLNGFVELGPGLGSFGLVAGSQGGLRPPLDPDPVIRFRAGGEMLKPAAGRPRKRLKDLCQEVGIVPWMRTRLPLVFVGTRLAAVGDLWIDADLAAPPGGPALQPVWNDRPALY